MALIDKYAGILLEKLKELKSGQVYQVKVSLNNASHYNTDFPTMSYMDKILVVGVDMEATREWPSMRYGRMWAVLDLCGTKWCIYEEDLKLSLMEINE